MNRMGDADWWWDHALEGVVGSIIGGLVTVAVLLITLRHARNRANEDLFIAECRRLLQATRDLKEARVREASSSTFPVMTVWYAWSSDARNLGDGVAAREPCFWALLNAAREQVDGNFPDPSLESAATKRRRLQLLAMGMLNAEILLSKRLLTPAYFKMNPQECRQLEAQIGAGERLD